MANENKQHTNPVLVELLATLRRMEIIKNNTSDEITKELAKDMVKVLGNTTRQMELVIESESKQQTK